MDKLTALIRNPLNSLTEQDRAWLEILHPEQIRRITANFAPKGCSHSGTCANSGQPRQSYVTNVEPLPLPGFNHQYEDHEPLAAPSFEDMFPAREGW